MVQSSEAIALSAVRSAVKPNGADRLQPSARRHEETWTGDIMSYVSARRRSTRGRDEDLEIGYVQGLRLPALAHHLNRSETEACKRHDSLADRMPSEAPESPAVPPASCRDTAVLEIDQVRTNVISDAKKQKPFDMSRIMTALGEVSPAFPE